MKLLLISILGFFMSIVNASIIFETSAARDALVRVYNYANRTLKDTSDKEKNQNLKKERFEKKRLEKQKAADVKKDKLKISLETMQRNSEIESNKLSVKQKDFEKGIEEEKKNLEEELKDAEKTLEEKKEIAQQLKLLSERREKGSKKTNKEFLKLQTDKEMEETKFRKKLEKIKKEEEKGVLIIKIEEATEGKCKIDEKELEYYDLSDLEALANGEEKGWLCLLARYPDFFTGIPTKIKDKDDKDAILKIFSLISLLKTLFAKQAAERVKNILIDGMLLISKTLPISNRSFELMITKEKSSLGKNPKDNSEILFFFESIINDQILEELKKGNGNIVKNLKEAFKGYDNEVEATIKQMGNFKDDHGKFLSFLGNKIKDNLENEIKEKKVFISKIKEITKDKCKINETELYEYDLNDLEALANKEVKLKDSMCLLARYPRFFAGIPAKIKGMDDNAAILAISSMIRKKAPISVSQNSAREAEDIITTGIDILSEKLFNVKVLFDWIIDMEKSVINNDPKYQPNFDINTYKKHVFDTIMGQYIIEDIDDLKNLKEGFKDYAKEVDDTIKEIERMSYDPKDFFGCLKENIACKLKEESKTK